MVFRNSIYISVSLLLLAVLSLSACTADTLTDAEVQEEIDTYNIEGLTEEYIRNFDARIEAQKSRPDVIQNAPYRHMIMARPETKKTYLKYISEMDISDIEKEKMTATFEDIWERAPDNITKNDYPKLEWLGTAIHKHIERHYLKNETLNTERQTGEPNRWNAAPHQDFIYYGCLRVYSNTSFANNAKAHANDPDADGFEPFGLRQYNHYYNPSLGIGGAPSRCYTFATYAQNNYSSGQLTVSSTNLGIASHYISDVGNPMHTGQEWAQGLNSSIHSSYEAYVSGNWSSGHNYKDIVSSNTQSKTVTNPSNAVVSLATYSNSYLDILMEEIEINPTGYGSDIDVRFLTTRVICETAKYNVGLADYVI